MGIDTHGGELTSETVEHAEFQAKVDPVDLLRRIAVSWIGIRDAVPFGGQALVEADEIDFLLSDAFHLPEGR